MSKPPGDGESLLSAGEKAAIGQATQRVEGAERRRHKRLAVGAGFPLLVRVDQPPGGSFVSVTARNVSSSGIGFHHSAYMHPGSVLTLILKSRKGAGVTVTGVVTHCRHVSGRVHEIGVLFHKEIRTETFIAAAGGKESEQESSDIHSRIEAMAAELQGLAAERKALDAILKLIGKLALLASPNQGVSPPPPPPPQGPPGQAPASQAPPAPAAQP